MSLIAKFVKKVRAVLRKTPVSMTYYYYVPRCPVCGSWKTGHYIKEPKLDAEYTYRKALEHGEIIRFAKKEPVENCFCTECGHKWGKHIFLSMISYDELVHQQEIRGTNNEYELYAERYFTDGKPPRPGAFNRWFL